MDNILKVLFARSSRSSTMIVMRNDCRYSNHIFLCIYRNKIDNMRIFTGGGYERILNNADARGERLNLRNNTRVEICILYCYIIIILFFIYSQCYIARPTPITHTRTRCMKYDNNNYACRERRSGIEQKESKTEAQYRYAFLYTYELRYQRRANRVGSADRYLWLKEYIRRA